uniref:RRM domain-containing protein n=1 Tax=Aegilops tauschii subsp. strangulata TaxID=200361 RepID=A0A453FJB4_AEGTS
KRTVVVENLPLDFSLESIQEKFGSVGKIMKITIHDPHAVGESAASKKPDFMLSNKVCCKHLVSGGIFKILPIIYGSS